MNYCRETGKGGVVKKLCFVVEKASLASPSLIYLIFNLCTLKGNRRNLLSEKENGRGRK